MLPMGAAREMGIVVSWPQAQTSQEEVVMGAKSNKQPKTHCNQSLGTRWKCGITVAGTVSAKKASSDPSEWGRGV